MLSLDAESSPNNVIIRGDTLNLPTHNPEYHASRDSSANTEKVNPETYLECVIFSRNLPQTKG